MSNYATKTVLKNLTWINTSSFARKLYLANLKSDVDKLDIDKLENLPTNLSNLKSKVIKSDLDKITPASFDLIKLSDVLKWSC